jgi:L-ascorbate metabolism protein UlaG (beta-lactamase superfamily)
MKFSSRLITTLLAVLLSATVNAQMLTGDKIPTDNGDLTIHPVSHASFVMEWDGKTIYVDPVGGVGAYDGLQRPDLILLTDIHGDHMDAATLEGIAGNSLIIAPAAVKEQLPAGIQTRTMILDNDNNVDRLGINIAAIPMYNLTEERLQFHDKGRGNGYVLTMGGKRVYISGDTEDIPEMRALENIDVAFVCFNLPYTMTESQAASAVNEFKPAIVYPYHYRGSDLALFTGMIEDGIEVRQGAWY